MWQSASDLTRGILETLLNNFESDDGKPELKNAASPFYEVEAGNILWGTKDNQLLVALNTIIGGPTKFSLQVCCYHHHHHH